ncbi:MAG: hypothetical protein MUO72_13590 [Bacteroidales bacterium]|nr:hypothetical protein [Bacteroidales bacterium]
MEFDNALQTNSGVDLKSTGGLKPNPAVVAQLLDVDYENYVSIVTGKKISDNCVPCGKTKVIQKGAGVLSYRTFLKRMSEAK